MTAAGTYRLPYRVRGCDVLVEIGADGERIAECVVPLGVDVDVAFGAMEMLGAQLRGTGAGSRRPRLETQGGPHPIAPPASLLSSARGVYSLESAPGTARLFATSGPRPTGEPAVVGQLVVPDALLNQAHAHLSLLLDDAARTTSATPREAPAPAAAVMAGCHVEKRAGPLAVLGDYADRRRRPRRPAAPPREPVRLDVVHGAPLRRPLGRNPRLFPASTGSPS